MAGNCLRAMAAVSRLAHVESVSVRKWMLSVAFSQSREHIDFAGVRRRVSCASASSP
jgi:hypothetical protein